MQIKNSAYRYAFQKIEKLICNANKEILDVSKQT